MIPPTYQTQRFILKPYEPKDEDRFVEMALDAESVKFMGGSTGKEADERVFFQSIAKLYKRQDKRWLWVWGVYEDNCLRSLRDEGYRKHGSR